jgi:hypothetical protein
MGLPGSLLGLVVGIVDLLDGGEDLLGGVGHIVRPV